jgi:hypothetical protein
MQATPYQRLVAVRMKYAAGMAVAAERMLEGAKMAIRIERKLHSECVAIAGEGFEQVFDASFKPKPEFVGADRDEDVDGGFYGVKTLAEQCLDITTPVDSEED